MLGLPQLQQEIDDVAKELASAEEPAAMAAGVPIRDKWKELVPVLDGDYRDSLTVAWTGKGAAVGTRWLADRPRTQQPVLYAKRLEFGDASYPAEPSARPALAASREAALEAGGAEFRPVVRGRKPRRRVPKA